MVTLDRARVPYLSTAHGSTSREPGRLAYERFPGHPLVAVSDAQRRLGLPGLNWIATVPNGIDLDEFTPAEHPTRDYLLHSASFGRRKGTAQAIDIAVAAGIPLVLMGVPNPAERHYFDAEIAPRLNHPLISYAGDLDGAERVRMVRNARALLHPIQWPEPFGLVYVEALACGVPVLTYDEGAAREIVRHGQTGCVATTPAELIAAAGDLDGYDPAACRASVAHLSVDAMTRRYLDAYQRVRDDWRGPRRAVTG
jgi:glycosyltransferase involved in cell wall biosynthesis